MPSKDKRVYTFDQLDAILRKRGTKNRHGIWLARLYSTMYVTAYDDSNVISLRFVGSDGKVGRPIADVYKAASGDSSYRVHGIYKEMGGSPQGRAMYRRMVRRFTPRLISGRTPRYAEWFLVHNGEARPYKPSKTSFYGPENCSRAYVPATRPTCKAWLERYATNHPKLCGRARSFYLRLRRELRDSLPCVVQIGATASGQMPFLPKGPSLHVCTAPPKTGRPSGCTSSCATTSTNRGSTSAWTVTSATGTHRSTAGTTTKVLHRWRSTKEATVGVKEWVMSSVYIPGF